MFGPEFASCWLKIGRAEEHFQCLQSEIKAWTNSEPYSSTTKRNADGSRHAVSVSFNRTPPFDRLALIAGDCAHNLRSALDHWTYACAITKSGANIPPNARRLQFPICESASAFEEQKNRIAGVSAKAQAFIVRAQQYNRPQQDAPPLLSLLNEFDNSDKHRKLNVALAHVMGGEIKFTPPLRYAKATPYWLKTPIQGDSEVMFFNLFPPQPDVRYEYDLALYVTISHVPSPSGRHVSILEDVFMALVLEIKRLINEAATL
jgi:hypothetical protein